MSSQGRRARNKTVRDVDADQPAVEPGDAELGDLDAGDLDTGDLDTGDDIDEPDPEDIVVDEYQRQLESRREATIANARRRSGVAGAAMASVMLTMQDMIEGEKEEPAVIVQANSRPEDLDDEGITVELDGNNYHAPPLERLDSRDDGSQL